MRKLPVSQNWSMPPPMSWLPYSKRSRYFLHPLGPDAPGDLLIDRHDGSGDRAAQRVIAIPALDASDDAVPLEDVRVGIADHAGFQRNQRIRNLEGRGRQPRLAGTIPVAGNDQVILGLVADEGAAGALVGKMLRQLLADLTALRRDIGKATRRQKGAVPA